MKNKLKLIKSLFNNIILRKPTPYILLFEPSQLCNCKCEFCYHWKEYDKNELKKEEIFDILEQAYDLGCGYLILNGGEPFIAPYFEDTLKKSYEIGYNIGITTNGSMLHKIEKYYKYIDNLTVSIDSPDEKHDEYRRYDGLFKKAIDGIKYAKKYVPNIKINFSIHDENKDKIIKMLDLVKELDCEIFLRLLVMEHKELADIADFRLVIKNKDDIKKIANNIIKLKRNNPIVTPTTSLKYIKDEKKFKCYNSWFIMNIDSHGRIYPPCYKFEGTKELIFGSIREKKIKDIWSSKNAKDFRKFAKKCQPNMNCYTACILEPSLLLKPHLGMLFEQLTSNSNLFNFFRKRK